MVRYDGSRRSRFGKVWRGMERLGKAVGVRCGLAGYGPVGQGGRGEVR